MKTKDKKNTKFCSPRVDFEYLEIPPELAAAKHARIIKIFAGALMRAKKNQTSDDPGEGSDK